MKRHSIQKTILILSIPTVVSCTFFTEQNALEIQGSIPSLPASSVRHISEFYYPYPKGIDSVSSQILERCQKGEPVAQQFPGRYGILNIQSGIIRLGGLEGERYENLESRNQNLLIDELQRLLEDKKEIVYQSHKYKISKEKHSER